MSKATVPPTKDVLLKSYQKRLKDDINSMMTNFNEIIKLCRVEEENQISRSTQCEEDGFEMQVRAANMVRASESLMKLISDIKQYLILNDFPSVNQAIAENSKGFLDLQNKCDLKLTALRDDISADLYDLEEEYYLSQIKYGDREKEKSDSKLSKYCANQIQFIGKTVMVNNNDIDTALRTLNGIMANEGIYQRWMLTRRYEKPTKARQRINYERSRAIYTEDMTNRISFMLRKNRKDPYPGC